jgi:hypothetical protein
MSKSGEWKNRIIGHEDVAPDQLLANPRNWRIHPRSQQQGMESILDELGIIAPVTVNKRTGHLVDGHMRVQLALSRDQPTVPVQYVDLSEEEEALALATLDPIGDLAAVDRDQLSELLEDVGAVDGLDDLLADLADQAATQQISEIVDDPLGQASDDVVRLEFFLTREQAGVVNAALSATGQKTPADAIMALVQGR